MLRRLPVPGQRPCGRPRSGRCSLARRTAASISSVRRWLAARSVERPGWAEPAPRATQSRALAGVPRAGPADPAAQRRVRPRWERGRPREEVRSSRSPTPIRSDSPPPEVARPGFRGRSDHDRPPAERRTRPRRHVAVGCDLEGRALDRGPRVCPVRFTTAHARGVAARSCAADRAHPAVRASAAIRAPPHLLSERRRAARAPAVGRPPT